jgi:hypothetical protein
MNQRKAFDCGVLSGMLLMLSINALYWFVATWRPEVEPIRTLLVALQGVGCLAAAVIFTWRTRPRRQAA